MMGGGDDDFASMLDDFMDVDSGKDIMPDEKVINEQWHEGSYDSPTDSLVDHFNGHGNKVGAHTPAEYLDMANDFKKGFKKGTGKPVQGHTSGVERFTRDNQYVHVADDGRIISFGTQN